MVDRIFVACMLIWLIAVTTLLITMAVGEGKPGVAIGHFICAAWIARYAYLGACR